MTDMTAMRRSAIVASLALLLVLVAAGGLLFILNESSSAQDVDLPNITREDLAQAFISIEPAELSEAEVSREDAESKAVGESSAADEVTDADLVRITAPGKFAAGAVAWAVSLDPAKTGVIPPLGLPPEGETFAPTETRFAVVFIDAKTGEFMFSWQANQPIALD